MGGGGDTVFWRVEFPDIIDGGDELIADANESPVPPDFTRFAYVFGSAITDFMAEKNVVDRLSCQNTDLLLKKIKIKTYVLL